VTIRATPAVVGLAAAALGAAAVVIAGDDLVVLLTACVAGLALGAAADHPRAGWIVGAAAVAASAPFGPAFGMYALAAAHAFYAGRHEALGPAVVALAALVGALELGLMHSEDVLVPALLLPGAAWGAGRALRERELVAAQLAERVRELQEEREAHAALSVRYERARIASELHDIVAHAISVMVVQASAGQRLAHDPEATAEAFDAIAGAARQAEQDMGRLVALLGDEDAIGPAPDLALVEELVARAAGSGLDVTLRLEGEREGLPVEVAESAYRVVQEGLTNALRYAAGATVAVTVRGEDYALVVSVENGPARNHAALEDAGTGNGLRGLRERLGSLGGTLRAGPTDSGGWCVSAHLPTRVSAGRSAAAYEPAAPARAPGSRRRGP
jgi:signal transduction histidine kinase